MRQYLVSDPKERVAIYIWSPTPNKSRKNLYSNCVWLFYSLDRRGFRNKYWSFYCCTNLCLPFQFICRFAVPRQVHTDHVTQFESDLLKEIYKLLGIDKTKTTPYYPRSDDLVERFNRTLKCMLNKYIENTQKTGIYNYPYWCWPKDPRPMREQERALIYLYWEEKLSFL